MKVGLQHLRLGKPRLGAARTQEADGLGDLSRRHGYVVTEGRVRLGMGDLCQFGLDVVPSVFVGKTLEDDQPRRIAREFRGMRPRHLPEPVPQGLPGDGEFLRIRLRRLNHAVRRSGIQRQNKRCERTRRRYQFSSLEPFQNRRTLDSSFRPVRRDTPCRSRAACSSSSSARRRPKATFRPSRRTSRRLRAQRTCART